MAERLLFDTDILIDYLRGDRKASEFLEKIEAELVVSAITVAELSVGTRGSEEERALEKFLLAFEVLPVTTEVARLGGALRRDYMASHGTGLADALIAATARLHHAALVTFNIRHFPMLADIRAPYSRG